MNTVQAQQEAQELVDITRQIKNLEAEAERLRLGLMGYVTEHGAIDCSGGRVIPREHYERPVLDPTLLRKYMIEALGISPDRVTRAFEDCTNSTDVMPGVSVRLDTIP